MRKSACMSSSGTTPSKTNKRFRWFSLSVWQMEQKMLTRTKTNKHQHRRHPVPSATSPRARSPVRAKSIRRSVRSAPRTASPLTRAFHDTRRRRISASLGAPTPASQTPLGNRRLFVFMAAVTLPPHIRLDFARSRRASKRHGLQPVPVEKVTARPRGTPRAATHEVPSPIVVAFFSRRKRVRVRVSRGFRKRPRVSRATAAKP